MSSGDLEAHTASGSSTATQQPVGKIRILQKQLMIPGKAESSFKPTVSDHQHRLLSPVGVEQPTTSRGSTNRSEKGKMRVKVTGEESRVAAANKGLTVPALSVTVSPANGAAHKAPSTEASDRNRIVTPETARPTAVMDGPGRTNVTVNSGWVRVRSLPGSTSSSTESVPNVASRALRTVDLTGAPVLEMNRPGGAAGSPSVNRVATKETASSVRILTPPHSVKIGPYEFSTSLPQTNKPKLVPQQQPITVKYRNNQQTASVAEYKILPVASKSSSQPSSESTERTAIVLKKMPNDVINNLSSSSLRKKSTHKREASGAGGDSGRAQMVEPDNRTLASPVVDVETQTDDKIRDTENQRSVNILAKQLPNQQPDSAQREDSVDEQSSEGLDKSSTLSVDVAGKVSREVKLLKDTQTQSKILAEYIDDASRQGKLRQRRSTTGTPTSTTTSAATQVLPAAGSVGQRKRLQSRCFTAEDDATLALDTVTRRPGMRSESMEFRMKNRKFLNDMLDSSEISLMDDYVEEDSEETYREHPPENSNGVLNVTIENKQIDDTCSSLADPPKPGYDRLCFRCKLTKSDCLVGCSTCIRSFHKACARPTYNEASWSCQDCRASTLAHQTKPFPTEGDVNLHDCLQYVLEAILYNVEWNRLFNPLDKTAISIGYERVVTNHVDLVVISDKINSKKYVTTEDFLSDLTWIVHNMTLCRDSRMLASAKAMLRSGREEITLLETCRECFMHLKTQPEATWFIEACGKPHLLVWGKVKGFPYWPGKLMSINNNNQVLVVFFGQHDKAWIAVKECFLLSKRDPNSKSSKKLDFTKSLREVDEHVTKLIERFGTFNYAPFQTPLDIAHIEDHLLEMVPTGVRQEPPVVLKIITSIDGKMTASATTGDKTTIDSGTGETSFKRLTRRTSMAMANSSMEVSNIEPPPVREDGVKMFAKKRKSVGFDEHVIGMGEDGKIESLVIRRNSGNWETEPVSKRRKSVSRARRNSLKLTASEDSSGGTGDEHPSNDITEPLINNQPTESDVTMGENLTTKNNERPAEQHSTDSTDDTVIGDPQPTGNTPLNVTLSSDVDQQTDHLATKPVDQQTGRRAVGLADQQKVRSDKGKQSIPSGPVGVTAKVNKESPIILVPVPIKEEVPDSENAVSSTSITSACALEQLPEVQVVVTAATKISASNQRAKKSFPGSSATRAAAMPVGKSNAMMTIIPQAVGPERNSPLLRLGGVTEESVANSSAEASVDAASGDTSSAPLASVAPPAMRSPVPVSKEIEIPAMMQESKVSSVVPRSKNASGNVTRSCEVLPTAASTGTASIGTCPPSSLPDDRDVIFIDEPVSDSAASAVSSIVSFTPNYTRMPQLYPRPTTSKEEDTKLFFSDLIDGCLNQMTAQMRNLMEVTLGQLLKEGSSEAKIFELTRELEISERQRKMDKEEFNRKYEALYWKNAEDVSLAKQRMWCRRCQQEAKFYCCWNTAYCSNECQQEHWIDHQLICTHNLDARRSISSRTYPIVANPYPTNEAHRKKSPGRQRSVGGYQDQSAPRAVTTAPHSLKEMPSKPVVQRTVSATSRQQPHIMTPKIHTVHGQVTNLHNLPYSNHTVNGVQPQRQLTPTSGPASTFVRGDLNNDERRSSGVHTLAPGSSNGTLGRIMSASAAIGRGGPTGSTKRSGPPLPPGAWNQIIQQVSPGAAAPPTGRTFAKPAAYGIGAPRGVGVFMDPPPVATSAGGSLPSAVGPTNNGFPNGDAAPNRDPMARRHQR